MAMYNLYKIRQIRLVQTEEVCRTIIQGLVLSHLDFANSILAASPDNIMKMLQRVQNIAAKVILGKNRQDSALACLIKLHWLPIKEHIEHKVLTLVYNCLNNNAPDYLKNLLTELPSRGKSLRSNEKHRQLLVPFTRKATFADGTFSVYGPKLWNRLPNDIIQSVNEETFKRNIKTYLFKKAFLA